MIFPNYPDYSDFLNQEGMLAHIEEEWQKNKHIHEVQANVVNKMMEISNASNVIEIGCATGNLASLIVSNDYLGVDKNYGCVDIARAKNPDKFFIAEDIRNLKGKEADVVCAFAIMKHFGLHEWDDIFSKIVKLSSNLVIIDMPIVNSPTMNDGALHGHHHVWMNEQEFRIRLNQVNLVVIHQDHTNAVEPIFVCKKK